MTFKKPGHRPAIMRSALLVAGLLLTAAIVAPSASAAESIPEPVEVYGCFNGGVTIVILGTVSLQCVGGGLESVPAPTGLPSAT